MTEVLALKLKDAGDGFDDKKAGKIVAVSIPQFKDQMGVSAERWAQLYVDRMEAEVSSGKRGEAEAEFLYHKIKIQYPAIKSGLWGV